MGYLLGKPVVSSNTKNRYEIPHFKQGMPYRNSNISFGQGMPYKTQSNKNAMGLCGKGNSKTINGLSGKSSMKNAKGLCGKDKEIENIFKCLF